MPIFEYRCSACAHLEEVLQKHGEPPPPACPQCHKAGTFAKEMSRTSFQLKGGGWYKDLYASSKPGASSDGGTSSESASPAATSSTPSTGAASAPAAASPAAASPAASTSSSTASSPAPSTASTGKASRSTPAST